VSFFGGLGAFLEGIGFSESGSGKDVERKRPRVDICAGYWFLECLPELEYFGGLTEGLGPD
jgi:hypothetical protein